MRKIYERAMKFLRRVYNFSLWLRFALSMPVVVQNKFGIKFVLYPWQKKLVSWLVQGNEYEKEFGASDKLLSAGNIVVDVGANVGINSTYYSRLVGSEGVVHSIEPVSATAHQLRTTLGLNSVDNVTVHQIALGGEENKVTIFSHDQAHSAWSSLGLSSFKGVTAKPQQVNMKTLDGFCSALDLGQIDFLKIDVEGYEIEVLRGGAELLNKGRVGVVQFEVSPDVCALLGREPNEILVFLNSFGYEVYQFDGATEKFIGPMRSLPLVYDNYYACLRSL